MPPVIHADVPWAARSAGPAGMREHDRALPQLLLHIACQAGDQIPAGLPTHYLCGAPVRLLLGAIAPGDDGPDGPGVCPICAALDHPGRLPGQTGKTNISRAATPAAARPGQAARSAGQRIRRPAWRVLAAWRHVGPERTGHDLHCRAGE